MAKKKSLAQMTEKERRREAKKIQKQIAQGRKKIKLPDGRVIDGKQQRALREHGQQLRSYYEQTKTYLNFGLAAAIIARVATAWAIPGGFRVLVCILCVPFILLLRVLLNALVPAKYVRQNGQVQMVQESGGSNFHNALFLLASTIEVTKFFQFVLEVFRSASTSTDATLRDLAADGDVASEDPSATGNNDEFVGGEGGNSNNDKDWKPPEPQPPTPKVYDIESQNIFTRMFLYSIPFVFGGALVLFVVVAYLRATAHDPQFGGSNLRVVPVSECVEWFWFCSKSVNE